MLTDKKCDVFEIVCYVMSNRVQKQVNRLSLYQSDRQNGQNGMNQA